MQDEKKTYRATFMEPRIIDIEARTMEEAALWAEAHKAVMHADTRLLQIALVPVKEEPRG